MPISGASLITHQKAGRGLDRASVPQHLQQEVHVMTDFRNRVAKLCDLAARVENGRVVTAPEIAADFRQRKLSELLGERHRDLARTRDRA